MNSIVEITDAQYIVDADGNNVQVRAKFDGVEVIVPMDRFDRHYDEILAQLADGRLASVAPAA